MAKRLNYWLLTLTAVFAFSGCTSSKASQRSLFGTESTGTQAQFEVILDALGVLGIELRRLEETYQEVKTTSSLIPFAEQFAAAQDAYLIQDYTATATLLQSLVSDTSNSSEPLYRAATYYLADSHFNIGNHGIARLHFSTLAADHQLPYGLNSVTRLLQLAMNEGNWQALIPHLNSLLTVKDPDATAAYSATHGFIKLGRYQDASHMASKVPTQSPWYAKSLYLQAVASIHQGQLPSALSYLSSITLLKNDTHEKSNIKELAQLARARVLFEIKDYSGAQNAYQDIPRDSPYFAESMYEIAHTYVGKGQSNDDLELRRQAFQNALGALDLLLLFAKNKKTLAEASLLKANILLWLERRGESKELLDAIQERYQALGSSFESLPGQIEKFSTYYDLLSKKRYRKTNRLPEMVVNHLESGPELRLSRNVVQEVEETHEIIRELRSVITELKFKIKYDPNGHFLKSGQQAYKQVDRLRLSFDKLSKQLIDVDIQLLRPFLNEPKRKDLDTRVDEMAAVKTELYVLEGRTRALVTNLRNAPLHQTKAPTKPIGQSENDDNQQIKESVEMLRKKYQQAVRESRVLRRQYVIKFRRVQDFLQANHKVLAQTKLGLGKTQAALTPRINELSAQRARLSKSLATNRTWQEKTRKQVLHPNWSMQEQTNGLRYLLKDVDLFPDFLKPRVRDWLKRNIQTCLDLLKELPETSTPARKNRVVRRTVELLVHGLSLMEAELNHTYHRTFEQERAILLTRPQSSEQSGLWLALSLERAGKVLTQLRSRATALEAKIKLHTRSRLNHMKVLLTRELRNLDAQHAALTLAAARTKRIVGKVANLSLTELGHYVSNLLMRCDVGYLDITWQAKLDKVEKVNAVLVGKRKALKEHARERNYLMNATESPSQ